MAEATRVEQEAGDIRIYVRCLSSYNAGDLRGRWIDATLGADHLREQIREELEATRAAGYELAEEYAVHDYEGFGDLASSLGEWPDLDRVAELAELIREHGGAFLTYAGHVGADYATAGDFRDRYRGEYASPREYAEEFIADCYDLEKMMGNLAHYFDYESFAHDLEVGGDMAFVPGGKGVYAFDNH